MGQLIDLTGQKFGRLKVICKDEGKYNCAKWICECDCGKRVSVASSTLRGGVQVSCGCYSREHASQIHTENLAGQRFGRLVVLYRVSDVGQPVKWHCVCDCGNEINVLAGSLKSGATQSCKCLLAESTGDRSRKHGMYKSRQYRIWMDMKMRCYDKKSASYIDYGGRGITVCDEWLNSFETFNKWLNDNNYSDELSIDRIDVNGNYNPDNCRMANSYVQANNTRKNRHLIIAGVDKTVAEWAEIVGINPNTIYGRLFNGWSARDAVFKPLCGRRRCV